MVFNLLEPLEFTDSESPIFMNAAMQNFLFKSSKDDSPLKATDFGLSDYIKPGTHVDKVWRVFEQKLVDYGIAVAIFLDDASTTFLKYLKHYFTQAGNY